MPQSFYYGGQAIIEGVLIRGQHSVSMAVRCPNGTIWTGDLEMGILAKGPLRKIPLVRGMFILLETLILGVRALNRSAEISMVSPEESVESRHKPTMSERLLLGVSMGIALIVGIGFFFLVPLFGARSMDGFIASSLVSNAIEGVIRLILLVGYMWMIGRMEGIQRVFAYHGAEHMAIHAYEHGEPLDPETVSRFPKAHPRCGTAFLLTVVVVSIFIFALLGRPSMEIAILSRLVLVPVIASVSYEFLRLGATHESNPLARLMILPGLALQRLTTRIPDNPQIEVAITAMECALKADRA